VAYKFRKFPFVTNNVPSLLVAVANHAAVVKVNGRANFTTSVSFKRLLTELFERDFQNFVLDLSDCVTMDSTFLGVLAGMALRLSDAKAPGGQNTGHAKPAKTQLRLLNPNQRVTDLLDNLGVSDLFCTFRSEEPLTRDQDLTPAAEANPTRQELSTACLEAHRILMAVNPDNVARFKDVAQFLAEDAKKLGSEGKN
jgi:anti-anti-sigma regulatory factor